MLFMFECGCNNFEFEYNYERWNDMIFYCILFIKRNFVFISIFYYVLFRVICFMKVYFYFLFDVLFFFIF